LLNPEESLNLAIENIKKRQYQTIPAVIKKHSLQQLLSRQFISFEELVAAARYWNADFRQVSASCRKPEVQQLVAGNILLSTGWFDCHVDQRGQTPGRMRTIALPHIDCSEFRWFGYRIDSPALLVFPLSGEIDAISKPGFHVTTMSIPAQILDEYCERNFQSSSRKMIGSDESILQVKPDVIEGLMKSLKLVSRLSRLRGDTNGHSNAVASFEAQLLDTLFQNSHGTVLKSRIPGRSGRNRVLDSALQYIENHQRDIVYIHELCAAIRVPERTLRAVFQREFGISPKRFLLGRKMYGVHRELWNSSPAYSHVSDLANAWGFWHMGQFAKDYRSFFGELPNDTLKKSGKV